MESYSLVSVCITSLLAVFFVLTLLSLLMRLIMVIFPAKTEDSDTAVMAALSTVLSTIYPGAKISKIKELK